MIKKWVGVGIVIGIVLGGCSHSIDSGTAKAFQKVSPSVVTADVIELPTNSKIDADLATMGGYPVSATVSSVKKADGKEFSVGYDSHRHPVVVVTAGQAVEIITDPQEIGGYAAKAHTLTGRPVATDSSSSDSSKSDGPSGGEGAGQNIKGCPIKIGDSRAHADHVLGKPLNATDYSDGSTIVLYAPFDAVAVGENSAIAQVTSFIPFGGGIAQDQVTRSAHHAKSYAVTFQDGVVSSIQVTH